MDHWEGNSNWPRKRMRLEHTIESQVSYNYSISQSITDDSKTRQGGGYDHSVYGQEPPRLNPDLADYDDVNSLNWSLDTPGHLDVDYRITSSSVLTQSTADTPLESMTYATSNLPGKPEISPSNEDGGPKEVFANEVCFGMVTLQLFRGALQPWE